MNVEDQERDQLSLTSHPLFWPILVGGLFTILGLLVIGSFYFLWQKVAENHELVSKLATTQATQLAAVAGGDEAAATETATAAASTDDKSPRSTSSPTGTSTPTTLTTTPSPTVTLTLTPTSTATRRPLYSFPLDEDGELEINVRQEFAPGDNVQELSILFRPVQGVLMPADDVLIRDGDFLTGSVTYLPNEDYFGDDSFTLELCDNTGSCSRETVRLRIQPVNDAPTADDDIVTFTEDDDARDITAQLLNGDQDAEDATLSIVDVEAGGSTRVTFSGGAGTVLYDPGDFYNSLADGETATESFQYTIRDRQGLTDTATVTVQIEGQNDVPVAENDGGAGSPDIFFVDEDTLSEGLTSSLLSNDIDPDVAQQSLLEINDVNNNASGGEVSFEDGDWRYDPLGAYETLAEDETAADTFTYSIIDPDGSVSNQATVRMTIVGVNDPPSLTVSNLSAPITFSPTTTSTTSVPVASTVEIADIDSDNVGELLIQLSASSGRLDEQDEYLVLAFQGEEIISIGNSIVIQSGLFSINTFVTALQSTEYVNLNAAPTAGCRQIDFQIFDDFGAPSNVQTVYIQVGDSVCPTPSQAALPGSPTPVKVPAPEPPFHGFPGATRV